MKAALTVRKLQNVVAAKIAGTNWGKGLDLETRRAVSDWANRVGIDPAVELDVLGGKFYKNVYYYLRKLSDMVEAKRVVYAYVEHVEVDARLVKIAADKSDADRAARARKEMNRREDMRIQYNIPDKATGAAVFHIMLTEVSYEFSAAKWCGGGTRAKDPVGDEFPVETSESRAIRRTLRLVASQNPAFASMVEPNDDDAIDAQIGDTLRQGLARAKADQLRAAELARGHPIMQLPAGDPYGLDVPKKVEQPEPVDELNDRGPRGEVPGDVTAPPADELSDLDLLSPDERRDYEEKKRLGRT